ncbi:hypothetical protein BGX27_008547 [Mortierella sp. AM989]|nr:hypothetical protein BGX27_008547 [Mortierella sp. AM989]
MHISNTYNILLLGQTQSGKSTLLERIKQYANKSYVPNIDLIGNASQSCTQNVRIEEFTTNLPIYEPIKPSNNDGYGGDDDWIGWVENDNDEEYGEVELPVKIVETGDCSIHYRIFDTPGLNDTNGNDIRNLANIIEALFNVETIHLILITDNYGAALLDQTKDALKTYSTLLTEVKDLVYFVYTRVPNILGRPQFHRNLFRELSARTSLLKDIMGQEITTKTIDCGLDEKKPEDLCAMFHKIREILQIASITPAVRLNALLVHKPLEMVNTDQSVKVKYDNEFAELQKHFRDLATKTTNDINDLIRRTKEVDTDDLCEVYRYSFNQDWRYFQFIFNTKMVYEHKGKLIDHKQATHMSVNICEEKGGEGHSYWSINFKRKPFTKGYYNVVLSIKKRNMHSEQIEMWRLELKELEATLQELEFKLPLEKGRQIPPQGSTGETLTPARTTNRILANKLNKKHDFIAKMLDHAESKTLEIPLFLELARANIYDRPKGERHIALEKFLAEKFEYDLSELGK